MGKPQDSIKFFGRLSCGLGGSAKANQEQKLRLKVEIVHSGNCFSISSYNDNLDVSNFNYKFVLYFVLVVLSL